MSVADLAFLLRRDASGHASGHVQVHACMKCTHGQAAPRLSIAPHRHSLHILCMASSGAQHLQEQNKTKQNKSKQGGQPAPCIPCMANIYNNRDIRQQTAAFCLWRMPVHREHACAQMGAWPRGSCICFPSLLVGGVMIQLTGATLSAHLANPGRDSRSDCPPVCRWGQGMWT